MVIGAEAVMMIGVMTVAVIMISVMTIVVVVLTCLFCSGYCICDGSDENWCCNNIAVLFLFIYWCTSRICTKIIIKDFSDVAALYIHRKKGENNFT